tara:strand:- start:1646 stop:3028 length:1383 start_codon:yes stop_codon:yes gene_type:complete
MTSVVVVGGGTTGALVCGMLCSSSTTKNWNIINVRSEDIPIIEVGESTVPIFARALRFMGIEQEFFEKTSAWPKYGAIFRGWQKKDLIGGWPMHGDRQETMSYLKGLTEQKKIPRVGQYILEGKYPYTEGGFYSDITLHIDANETAEFIFNKFDPQIDTTIYGNVNKVVITEGKLKYIVVDDEVVQGDYFIDATGFKRVLINHFNPKFIESKLPCNAAVFTSIEEYDDYKTDMMTTSTAAESGWMWNIPLEGKRGRGYVYSSDFLSDEGAAEEFGEDQPTFLKYKPGWLETPAVGNCFAIGLSNGFLDALDSPSIGMTVGQIFRFLKNYETPEKYKFPFKRVENYLMLHYRCCTKSSPFWDSIPSLSKEEVIQKYREVIETPHWKDPQWQGLYGVDLHGFTLSNSARILSNAVDIDGVLAKEIYNTVSKEERDSIKNDYDIVPWSIDLFKKHLSQGRKDY